MADVKDRPAASDDADLILKLQEKLDSLKNQVHNWTAKSKVFDQKENYNFDQFTKTLSSSPRNLRPAKSKSLAKGKKDWQSLSLAQQYEILHHVANEHTRVTLNFEALGLALKSSLVSNSLKATFSLQKGHSGLRMNTSLSKQSWWKVHKIWGAFVSNLANQKIGGTRIECVLIRKAAKSWWCYSTPSSTAPAVP